MPTVQGVKTFAGGLVDFGLTRLGLPQSETRLAKDAQAYWGAANQDGWRSHSHWRDGDAFAKEQTWRRIGEGHLALYQRLALAATGTDPLTGRGRVIEWGCGGGTNAVAFAPHVDEFIGVDVSRASLTECATQVGNACATPFTPIFVDLAYPERAAREVTDATCFCACTSSNSCPPPSTGCVSCGSPATSSHPAGRHSCSSSTAPAPGGPGHAGAATGRRCWRA